MNVKQLFIFLLFVCSASLSAATIFVSPSGSAEQSGSSWSEATTLANACTIATAGDQIWAVSGTYLPGNQQSSTFTIKSGVKLYGGFSGEETAIDQRNPQQAPSILSGNIGDQESSKDNVQTIITMLQANGETVLDGFTITAGEARDRDRNMTLATTAGALYISGSESGQGPIINNCIFTNNRARFGGAIFIDGKEAASSPIFTNCQFTDNKSSIRGGAIYSQGNNGAANPIFQNCIFRNNKSDRGACLFNEGTNGESNPLIEACEFKSNQALTDGAVIYNLVENGKGDTNHIMIECNLEDNSSYMGNDIASNHKVNNETPRTVRTQSGGKLKAVN